MSLDTVVFLVGLVIGCFLVVSVALVYITKNKFGTGGIVLSLIGFVLMGLFVFSRFKISIPGVAEIEAELREAQGAIQEIQAKKDAVDEELNRATQILRNLPPTVQATGQIRDVQRQVNLAQQASRQMSEGLALVRAKTQSVNNRLIGMKRVPK